RISLPRLHLHRFENVPRRCGMGGFMASFGRSSARRRSNRTERYGYVIFLIAAVIGALLFAYLFMTAHY
ncbi:MAG: hypothetical protein WBE14_03295, partial [Xanthobacteraceae bacterium]